MNQDASTVLSEVIIVAGTLLATLNSTFPSKFSIDSEQGSPDSLVVDMISKISQVQRTLKHEWMVSESLRLKYTKVVEILRQVRDENIKLRMKSQGRADHEAAEDLKLAQKVTDLEQELANSRYALSMMSNRYDSLTQENKVRLCFNLLFVARHSRSFSLHENPEIILADICS